MEQKKSSSSCLLQLRRHSFKPARQNFWSYPRLITSAVLQNLSFEEKVSLRKLSSSIKFHIDDHFRRELIRKLKSLKSNESLSHEKILVLCIEQFTKLNFNPPYLLTLIEKAKRIEMSCKSVWRELEAPTRLEDKEKLLKVFYSEADKYFNEKEKKIIFTLMLLQMIKTLSGFKFKSVHPSNRMSNLRTDFVFENIFFAIPFYNFVFDWFSFDRDWIQILLLITKFLDLKAAVVISNESKWVNLVRPMNFEHASVIFGMRNPFNNQTKTPSRVKCCFSFSSERSMTEVIQKFIKSEEFDWNEADKAFKVNCKFTTVGAKVCESSEVIKVPIVYSKRDFS